MAAARARQGDGDARDREASLERRHRVRAGRVGRDRARRDAQHAERRDEDVERVDEQREEHEAQRRLVRQFRLGGRPAANEAAARSAERRERAAAVTTLSVG